MTTLSTNFKWALLVQETEICDVCLITLTHDKWEVPIRLSTAAVQLLAEDPSSNAPIFGVISRNEHYVYVPIQVELPTSEEETPPQGRIIFSNVQRQISPYLLLVDKKYPKMTLEIVTNHYPNTIEKVYPDLELTSCSWDASTVEVTFSMQVASSESIPWLRFIPAYFPGMFAWDASGE